MSAVAAVARMLRRNSYLAHNFSVKLDSRVKAITFIGFKSYGCCAFATLAKLPWAASNHCSKSPRYGAFNLESCSQPIRIDKSILCFIRSCTSCALAAVKLAGLVARRNNNTPSCCSSACVVKKGNLRIRNTDHVLDVVWERL